jgi:hypothetical protein
MTGNGKIARLPWAIRDELNRRLRDGEPGTQLVDCLNGLPEVQDVLREHFGGRPITEQNLSEWKQRGYEDWLRHQEARAWVQDLTNQSLDIAEDISWESSNGSGHLSVADLLSAPLAIALGHCMQSTIGKGTEDPHQIRTLLSIAREVSRLRGGDHSLGRLDIERERQEAAKRAERKKLYDEVKRLEAAVEARCKVTEYVYEQKKKEERLSPEEEAQYQERFKKIAEWREHLREAQIHDHHIWAQFVV